MSTIKYNTKLHFLPTEVRSDDSECSAAVRVVSEGAVGSGLAAGVAWLECFDPENIAWRKSFDPENTSFAVSLVIIIV